MRQRLRDQGVGVHDGEVIRKGRAIAATLRSAAIAVAAVGFAAFPGGNRAVAAEIKLLASPGVHAVVAELLPRFESATGHRIVAGYDVIAVLKRRIAAGEAFDVVIPGPELIDELVAEGKVAPDAHAAFGRTGVALGVRKGAPKPDIATPESLKRALLASRSVGHSKEGQSGAAFLGALDRLGILQEMRPRLRAMTGGELAAAIQKGELDIVVGGTGPIREMQGADLVGGLPSELQRYVRFAIGVGSDSKEPGASRALMRFLTSPAVKPVFDAKGVERD
jgi:molybdate transport system substrate-binding protein